MSLWKQLSLIPFRARETFSKIMAGFTLGQEAYKLVLSGKERSFSTDRARPGLALFRFHVSSARV